MRGDLVGSKDQHLQHRQLVPEENGLVISEVQNGISSVQRRKKRNERDFQQQAGAKYN